MCASRNAQQLLTHVRQLLKNFADTKGFDRVMSKVEVLSVEPGKLKAQLKVEEEHVNGYGTLHGGMTCFLTDLMTTLAQMTTGNKLPGVSVDLSVSYMRPAKLNEMVTMDVNTSKSGSKLVFSTIDFKNEAGKLVAQGKHVKFVGK